MSDKKVNIHFRIVRSYGGDGSMPFHLEVIDEISGVEFLDVRFSVEAFADLLSNRNAAGVAEVRHTRLIGSKHEHKRELVPFDMFKHMDERRRDERDDISARTKSVVAVLKPFEVDGWVANISDLWNGHCRKDVKNVPHQWVGFSRFVHPESGIPIAR